MDRDVYEDLVAEVLRNHPAATREGVAEMLEELLGIVAAEEEPAASQPNPGGAWRDGGAFHLPSRQVIRDQLPVDPLHGLRTLRKPGINRLRRSGFRAHHRAHHRGRR